MGLLKLHLLVDLDETLVYRTEETKESLPTPPNDMFFVEAAGLYVKIRPYTFEFLESMAKHYEMTVVTLGGARYAEMIVKQLDPDQKFFGGRVIARDKLVDLHSKTKNLAKFFPGNMQHTAIIDDRVDVWDNLDQVVQVLPYHYSVDEEEEEGDVLAHMEHVLLEAHRRFHARYRNSAREADMQEVIRGLQRVILRGMTVALTGLPRSVRADCKEMLQRFGARVRWKITDKTTIVICDASTVMQADRENIPVLIVNWIRELALKWRKPRFDRFLLATTFCSSQECAN